MCTSPLFSELKQLAPLESPEYLARQTVNRALGWLSLTVLSKLFVDVIGYSFHVLRAAKLAV